MHMKEIEVKEKELQLRGIQTGQDISVHMRELESERLQEAARLQEQELRYQAEVNRANSDVQIAHANNLVKILTHQPKQHKEML